MSTEDVILDIRGLNKSFTAKRAGKTYQIRAVSDVDLAFRRGEVLGIVGESGCGNPMAAKLLATANSRSSTPAVSTNIDGSMIGEASQKAMTAESGTPIASSAAISGITPQEQKGDTPRALQRMIIRSASRKLAIERFPRDAQFRCHLLPAAFLRQSVPFSEPRVETVRNPCQRTDLRPEPRRLNAAGQQRGPACRQCGITGQRRQEALLWQTCDHAFLSGDSIAVIPG